MAVVKSVVSSKRGPYLFVRPGCVRGKHGMGRIDKALIIKSFMKRNGCQPDLITYNILLNHCCNELMLDAAVKVR